MRNRLSTVPSSAEAPRDAARANRVPIRSAGQPSDEPDVRRRSKHG
jgi:hypothetical protein